MGTSYGTRREPELYESIADIPTNVVGCLENLFQPSSDDSSDSGLRVLLRTLCGMAPVAFVAREEEPDDVGLVERCKDGTQVRYLSRSALRQCMSGILKIELNRATRVPNEDFPFFGRSDPFVVFTNGLSMVKSSVVDNSHNPTWNSTLYLLLRETCMLTSGADSLTIDMLDKDRDIDGSVSYQQLLDANSHIGSATIPIEQLKTDGVHSHEIQLLANDQTRGQTTLTFTTRFITVEDLLVELDRNDPSQWLDASTLVHHGSPWDALGQRLGSARVPLEPVAFFNYESEGTQAWIYRNTEAKCITLSYRSLQTDRIEDLLTAANITPGYITSIGSAEYVLQPTERLNQAGAFVHGGFNSAYVCCHGAILQTVYSLTDWDPTWTVALTGHSLGAALSTISAFEIANRRKQNGHGPQVGLFNFTSPRVGNREFCSAYDKTMSVSFRVRNRQDVIPAIPMTYYHVNQGLVLEDNGEIALEKREADFEGTIEEFDDLEWRRNNSQTKEAFGRSLRNISELLSQNAHQEEYHYTLMEAIVNHYFNQ